MAEARHPVKFFIDTAFAIERTCALKAALKLDLFTAIAAGQRDVDSLSTRCESSPRGIRILCDALVGWELLEKRDGEYHVPEDLAPILDRRSPKYLASALDFFASDLVHEGFLSLTTAVRQGGTAVSAEGTNSPDHPVWVTFARAMAPLASHSAHLMADLLEGDGIKPAKILDIAAGHGLYGLAVAEKNPEAEVVAVDWAPVLEVARENAEKAGVSDRFRTLAGSAFDIDLGSGYDLVLITNLLHLYDRETGESFLRKIRSTLAPGGMVVTLEMVPNEDKVSPELCSTFSLFMLAITPGGQAYTFSELDAMFRAAGFSSSELREIPPSFQRLVVARS